MTRLVPPPPGRGATSTALPVPDLARSGGNDRLSRGDLLYRLYLVVLFGGFYGYLLARTLITADVPSPSLSERMAIGAVIALTPLVAGAAGHAFGGWAGPVPITRPEAAILLPTLVDRRAWLLPRLWRGYLVAVVGGVGFGLAATVLLALHRAIDAGAWLAVPLLAALASVVGAGSAAVSQARPSDQGRDRGWTVALGAVALGVALAASVAPGRDVLAELGSSIVALAPASAAVAWLAGVAVAACVMGAVGRGRIVDAHDEALASHAGVHVGLAASATLGDLRALRSLRDPSSRARRIAAVPYPRRPAGVIRWRNLTALRARPGPLAVCLAGWAVATWLVTFPTAEVTIAGTVFRVVLATGALYLGTSPLLEPLRREHDSPLAAELIPFGFARLNLLHLRVCLAFTTALGLLAVPLAAMLTLGAWSPATWAAGWWSLPLVAGAVLLTAATTVIAAGDRVRQPSDLGDVMAALPAGAATEMLGVALAAMLLQPLVAMLPVALPVGLAVAAPLLADAAGPAVILGVVVGLLLVGVRAAGLATWLHGYERALQDADLLAPTSSLGLVWRRLRDGSSR